MQHLNVVIEKAAHNYSAYIEGVDGIVVTGKTIDEIKSKMHEAIDFTVETAHELALDLQDEIAGEYELAFKMDVQTMLEYYDGVLGKACLEKVTGINQKQLWHYASGKVKPREKQRERINKGLHNLGRELLLVNV